MTVTRSRGFTFIEVLIVAVMACVLAAIGLPRFLQAQTNARKSEAITQLKTLHAAMSTQAVMPTSIHVPGFDPPRGNNYSYHLSDYCASWEDRSAEFAVSNEFDDCIGVDTFANPRYPSVFAPVPLAGVVWDLDATANGMSTSAGFYGWDTNWDYLAYAAGDIDRDPTDSADTWSIASADAELTATCPGTPGFVILPAGEPFQVLDDKRCE